MKRDKYNHCNNLMRLFLTKSLLLDFNHKWNKFYGSSKLNTRSKFKPSDNLHNPQKISNKETYPAFLEIKLKKKCISSCYNIKAKALKHIHFIKFNINKNLFKSKWLLKVRFIFNNIIRNMNYEKKNKYG